MVESEETKMTPYEIMMIILIPITLSAAYAFKKHNDELLEQEGEEQREYYQFVKENWMYINNDNGGENE